MKDTFLTENEIPLEKGVILGGSGENAVAIDTVATDGRTAILAVDAGGATLETHVLPVYVMQTVKRGESVVVFSPDATSYTLYRDWLRDLGYDVMYINMEPTEMVVGDYWQPLPVGFDSAKLRDRFISATASALVNSARSLWYDKQMTGDVAAFTWSILNLLYLYRACGKKVALFELLDDPDWDDVSDPITSVYLNDLFIDYKNIFKDAKMSVEEIHAYKSMQSVGRTLTEKERNFVFTAIKLLLLPFKTFSLKQRNDTCLPVNKEYRSDPVSLEQVALKKTALFVTTSHFEASPFQPLAAMLAAQLNAMLLYQAESSDTGRLPVNVSVIFHHFSETMDYIYDLCSSISKLQKKGVNFLLTTTGLDPLYDVYGDKAEQIIHSSCVALMVVDPAQYFDKNGNCADEHLFDPWLDAANHSFADNPPHGEWHKVTDMPVMTSLIFPTPLSCNIYNFYVSDVFDANDHPSLTYAMASCILGHHSKFQWKLIMKSKKNKGNTDILYEDHTLQAAIVIHSVSDVHPVDVKAGKILSKHIEEDFPIFGVTNVPLMRYRGILPDGKYCWAEKGLDCDVFIRIGSVSNNSNAKVSEEMNKILDKIFTERAFRLRLVLEQYEVADEDDDSQIYGVWVRGRRVIVGKRVFDFENDAALKKYLHIDENGNMSFYLPGFNCNSLLDNVTTLKGPVPSNCLGLNPFVDDSEYILRLEIAPGRTGMPKYLPCDSVKIQPVILQEDVEAFEADKAAYDKKGRLISPYSYDKTLTFPYDGYRFFPND